MAIQSKETRTQYVATGNPDTVNDSSTYITAQPGQVLSGPLGTYQYVQIDSGATATAGIALAANQVLTWKDRTKYLATNDLRFSNRNEPAGILRNAATAGNYVFLMQRGDNITVKGTSGAVGDTAIVNSGTAADATNVAAGTAPTYVPLGIVKTATDATNIGVDLNIPSAP